MTDIERFTNGARPPYSRPMIRALGLLGALSALLIAPSNARAHGGQPAQAAVLTPEILGSPVDDSFLIEWLDAGPPPPPTGSALVNLFYTDEIPPTFPLGSIPQTLTGTVIVSGILEEDAPNEYLWDVSQVPSGHYWIWSRVDDPPAEMSAQYIRFPPVPLTVLHPGDEIGPAVAITRPDSEFSTGDEDYDIEIQSWDPTGTARIRIEAAKEIFGQEPDWMVVADNVLARPSDTVTWNTASIPEGDWMLRATITDCEGRTYQAYARYYLFITHLDPVDAGPREAGPHDGGTLEEWCSQAHDAGVPPDVDAGGGAKDGAQSDAVAPPPAPEEGGCRCSGHHHQGTQGWGGLLFLLLLATRWRGLLTRS